MTFPLLQLPFRALATSFPSFTKRFSIGASNAIGRMPPRPVINENDIDEAFLKGSGPGGQKINKTSSAVQLKHHPSGLVIKCQATRSRAQNRKEARRLLAEKLEEIEKGPESRVAMKAQEKLKKRANRRKKARKKYGKVGEGKGDAALLVEQGEEEEVVVDGGKAIGGGDGGDRADGTKGHSYIGKK